MPTLIYGPHRFELDPAFQQNQFAKSVMEAYASAAASEHHLVFDTYKLLGGSSITLLIDPAIPLAYVAD